MNFELRIYIKNPKLITQHSRLSHFLDNLFQLFRHFRKRFASYPHLAVSFFDREIEFCEFRIFVRIIVAEMSAAAFFAFEGGKRDRFGNGQQVVQIERRMPAGIEVDVAR